MEHLRQVNGNVKRVILDLNDGRGFRKAPLDYQFQVEDAGLCINMNNLGAALFQFMHQATCDGAPVPGAQAGAVGVYDHIKSADEIVINDKEGFRAFSKTRKQVSKSGFLKKGFKTRLEKDWEEGGVSIQTMAHTLMHNIPGEIKHDAKVYYNLTSTRGINLANHIPVVTKLLPLFKPDQVFVQITVPENTPLTNLLQEASSIEFTKRSETLYELTKDVFMLKGRTLSMGRDCKREEPIWNTMDQLRVLRCYTSPQLTVLKPAIEVLELWGDQAMLASKFIETTKRVKKLCLIQAESSNTEFIQLIQTLSTECMEEFAFWTAEGDSAVDEAVASLASRALGLNKVFAPSNSKVSVPSNIALTKFDFDGKDWCKIFSAPPRPLSVQRASCTNIAPIVRGNRPSNSIFYMSPFNGYGNGHAVTRIKKKNPLGSKGKPRKRAT